MKFLVSLSLIFFVFVSLAICADALKEKTVRFENGKSHERVRPVVVNIAGIKQAAEVPEEFTKHPFELEEQEKPMNGLRTAPGYTPQHSFQVDDSVVQSTTAIQAPTLEKKFTGIPAPSGVQPDNTIAAGPSQVMLAVNSSVAIFDKSGRRLFQTSFAEWFASLNVDTTNLFDPRLLYDQYSKHFIFMCDARRSDHRSWYLFSVSKTSNANGDWAFWALDMTLNADERVNLWADFPRIGVDQNAIYLTANMTDFVTFRYSYSKLRILKKSEVYSFGDVSWHDFWDLKDASNEPAFDITPAHSFGTAQTEYMVSTNLESGNVLTLWTISDGGSDDPIVSNTGVPVSSYSIAPGAVQKGDGNTTNPGTPNPVNVLYRAGYIYTAISVAHDWGTGERAAIRYFKVNRDGTLTQEITYGSKNLYYFYPAVMVNSHGDVFLVFNRSGERQYIGIYYAGRKRNDPSGKFSKSTPLQVGLTNYENPYAGSSFNRWGDYNGVARDPNGTIWIFSEFAKQRAVYGTTVGALVYPR